MKTILMLAFLLASTLASAQNSTVVVVSPKFPVNCLQDSQQLLNWIYKLQTIQEDSDQTQVQFNIQYGICYNRRPSPYAIDYNNANAYAFQNSFLWPWQKEGVKTEISYLTETEALVTMTFNKRVLFKKRNENHLSFHFEPGLQGPAYYQYGLNGQVWIMRNKFQFPWNVDVYLEGELNGNNLLKVQIR